MNLIEIWNKAELGQKITSKKYGDSFIVDDSLAKKLYTKVIPEWVLLADDWEIVKAPRKVVIEGIVFKDLRPDCSLVAMIDDSRDSIKLYNIKDTPMKMTLEWTE